MSKQLTGMRALKARTDREAKTAQQDVPTHLEPKKRIEHGSTNLAAAQNNAKKWVEERKAATKEKIAQWKRWHREQR